MKKKSLAMILAAVMFTCSGCSLLQTDGSANIEKDNDKGKNDKDNSDEGDKNNGDTQNAGNGGDNTDNGGADKDGEGEYDGPAVEAGPEYVIGTIEEEIGYESDGAVLVTGTDRIFIAAHGYEQLQKSLDDLFLSSYEITVNRWNYFEFAENYGNNPEVAGEYWNDNVYMDVSRNDSQIFTVNLTHDSYLGGAHPYSMTTSYNLDTSSGDTITLEEVVTDYDLLYSYVSDYLSKLNNEGSNVSLYPEWKETLQEMFYEQKNVQWMALEDGLNIYFNGYDIAPWVDGTINVPVLMEDNAGLFNRDYFHKSGTVKAAEDIKREYSAIVENVVMPLSQKAGVWNYDDCVSFVDASGFDYTCHEPYESEDSGEVRIADPETGYKMRLDFWPLDPDSTVYSKETDALCSVNYFNDDYDFMIDTFYNERDPYYAMIDYTRHEKLVLRSSEDFWKYLSFVSVVD